MKNEIFRSIALIFLLCFTNQASAQANNAKTQPNAAITYKLSKDTLLASSGQKIYVGQQFVLANPAGEDGSYRSIISKKAAIVPSIWGQDMRYENAIEHSVDSKKNRARVKATLVPGTVLTIKNITLCTTGKPHFYAVTLVSESNKYTCDIRLALCLSELQIQQ